MVHLHRKRRNSGLTPNVKCWETYVSLVGATTVVLFSYILKNALDVFIRRNLFDTMHCRPSVGMFHVFIPGYIFFFGGGGNARTNTFKKILYD